jgi:hypothetical protein
MVIFAEVEKVKFVELHCSYECSWNISLMYENNDAHKSDYKDIVNEI